MGFSWCCKCWWDLQSLISMIVFAWVDDHQHGGGEKWRRREEKGVEFSISDDVDILTTVNRRQ